MSWFSILNWGQSPTLAVTHNDGQGIINHSQSNRMRTIFILSGAFSGTLITVAVTQLFEAHREVLDCLYEMYQNYSFDNPEPLVVELILSEIAMLSSAALVGGYFGAVAAEKMYQNTMMAAANSE